VLLFRRSTRKKGHPIELFRPTIDHLPGGINLHELSLKVTIVRQRLPATLIQRGWADGHSAISQHEAQSVFVLTIAETRLETLPDLANDLRFEAIRWHRLLRANA
jgi:hypothetical protein